MAKWGEMQCNGGWVVGGINWTTVFLSHTLLTNAYMCKYRSKYTTALQKYFVCACIKNYYCMDVYFK